MIKKIYILAFFTFIFAIQSVAQQETHRENSFYLVPLNLINSGIRIDFEHQIKDNPLKRILIAPQFYYREIFDEEYPFRGLVSGELKGLGMEVDYKHFLSQESYNGHAYYAFGFSYQYFNLENTENTSLQSIQLHKLGSHFIIGYQIPISPLLTMDYFVGLGFRYSLDFSENGMKNEFERFSWNFGYSGPAPLLGFKIGFNL